MSYVPFRPLCFSAEAESGDSLQGLLEQGYSQEAIGLTDPTAVGNVLPAGTTVDVSDTFPAWLSGILKTQQHTPISQDSIRRGIDNAEAQIDYLIDEIKDGTIMVDDKIALNRFSRLKARLKQIGPETTFDNIGWDLGAAARLMGIGALDYPESGQGYCHGLTAQLAGVVTAPAGREKDVSFIPNSKTPEPRRNRDVFFINIPGSVTDLLGTGRAETATPHLGDIVLIHIDDILFHSATVLGTDNAGRPFLLEKVSPGAPYNVRALEPNAGHRPAYLTPR